MINKEEHLNVIKSFLSFLNFCANNPYILKGGTALSLCYSLNRFSEDVDLDAAGENTPREQFKENVERFCVVNNYSYRLAKDTPTTQRVFINYGNDFKPLKVEVSYRRREISKDLISIQNGIQVYSLNEMARLKAAAYAGRDRIRDLYDVSYICTHYYDSLEQSAQDALRLALEYKDIEQFDYIVQTQKDELIDPDILSDMFLEAFDKVGLLIVTDSANSYTKPSVLEPLYEKKAAIDAQPRNPKDPTKARSGKGKDDPGGR